MKSFFLAMVIVFSSSFAFSSENCWKPSYVKWKATRAALGVAGTNFTESVELDVNSVAVKTLRAGAKVRIKLVPSLDTVQPQLWSVTLADDGYVCDVVSVVRVK